MYEVAILLFDDVEVLDFAAPFEVLSLAGTRVQPGTLSVRTVSTAKSVRARNGLEVRASLAEQLPKAPDVLVLPGGPGVEPTMDHDSVAMRWISESVPLSTWVLSICSGALFLAKLGFLRGRRAITHHSDCQLLQQLEPSVQLEPGRRFVRDGHLITSAGIAAGLDASLYLVSELLGRDAAERTASWLEYPSNGWRGESAGQLASTPEVTPSIGLK